MVSGAGARPTAGARYVLERSAGPTASEGASPPTLPLVATPWERGEGGGEDREVVYRGFAHLPDEDVALEVRVELPSGVTKATLTAGEGSERDKELARTAAALVRSATKGGAAAGGPFPRKIVRWRATDRP